jgi:hypothetical protein
MCFKLDFLDGPFDWTKSCQQKQFVLELTALRDVFVFENEYLKPFNPPKDRKFLTPLFFTHIKKLSYICFGLASLITQIK